MPRINSSTLKLLIIKNRQPRRSPSPSSDLKPQEDTNTSTEEADPKNNPWRFTLVYKNSTWSVVPSASTTSARLLDRKTRGFRKKNRKKPSVGTRKKAQKQSNEPMFDEEAVHEFIDISNREEENSRATPIAKLGRPNS